MAYPHPLSDTLGDIAAERELLADILNVVAPFEVQKQPPLPVREEMVDAAGLAAEDTVFAAA